MKQFFLKVEIRASRLNICILISLLVRGGTNSNQWTSQKSSGGPFKGKKNNQNLMKIKMFALFPAWSWPWQLASRQPSSNCGTNATGEGWRSRQSLRWLLQAFWSSCISTCSPHLQFCSGKPRSLLPFRHWSCFCSQKLNSFSTHLPHL